ncbi:hypothetical protein S83_019858 [Arachis hypogaea]|nr:uncharacterized protein LOC112696838 [Arachis hypogaea]QHO46792.1 DDE_4 domain-containing protein [Arachis hypogaea]
MSSPSPLSLLAGATVILNRRLVSSSSSSCSHCFSLRILFEFSSNLSLRKGDITTNVLGVVALDMQFIYALAGWEGSAADSRVLRDALFRNGFSVPQGHYYLCDAGYMNCEGFLTPYR